MDPASVATAKKQPQSDSRVGLPSASVNARALLKPPCAFAQRNLVGVLRSINNILADNIVHLFIVVVAAPLTVDSCKDGNTQMTSWNYV